MRTGAIHDYLLRELGSSAHILELGSGEGTANLVKLFDKVTTVEHSPKWLNLVEGANYIHAPLVPYSDKYFRDATFWYDHEVLKRALPDDYDAIFVDGPKGSQGRGGFNTYFKLFKSDVLMVFDDVHRLWEFRLMGQVASRLNVQAVVYPEERWYGVVDGRSND